MDPILDSESKKGKPQSVSYFKSAFRYGLILGVASVILLLGAYLMGIDIQNPNTGSLSKFVVGIASLILAIVIYRMVMINHRDQQQGGYLSLGQAIGIGAVIGLASGIIAGLYAYIFGKFINPGYSEQIKAAYYEYMEKKGLTEEAMDISWAITQYTVDPNTASILQVISGPITGAIFGLIIGLFVKREFYKY